MHQFIVFKRRVDKGAALGHLANPTVHMGWRLGDFMEAQDGVLKTGTSTVGITFNGGVVVGADHRATMGHFIANKSVQVLLVTLNPCHEHSLLKFRFTSSAVVKT